MENVKDLVKEISNNLTQRSASSQRGSFQRSSSQKDELRVMRAMLNDTSYEVGVYGKEGQEGTICPAKEARQMITSVIASATKIPVAEAEKLANNYEFKKAEAANMITISKEFVNTYLETDRKLPLGKRKFSDVALAKKEVKATTRPYPKKVGVNDDGTPRYDKGIAVVKPHTSVRVISSCPDWIE